MQLEVICGFDAQVAEGVVTHRICPPFNGENPHVLPVAAQSSNTAGSVSPVLQFPDKHLAMTLYFILLSDKDAVGEPQNVAPLVGK